MSSSRARSDRRSSSMSICFVATIILLFSIVTFSQATEFTYQGSLKDGASLATGNYDLEFRLFDGGGTQLGSTQTRSSVAVANGIFSVKLDFGSVFPGADRFLEIAVRTAGGGSFTTLSPRQKIDSSPYSVKSLNATTADSATSAVSATNAQNAVTFSGTLSGDVTGTQSSTTVARLQTRNVANTPPTDGQVLKYNAATAQWRPDTDNTGAGGGGTITGVTAGTGLSGGGTTGSVSLSIATGGVGTAQIADSNVTDAKISTVSGAKVTGAVPTATNATQLGGVAANQFVQTSDPRLSDSRSPTAGSSNYVQNTTIAQPATNFNISGTGTAATFNAATQYNLSGNRILSTTGIGNLSLGAGSGTNTTGTFNVFVGSNAGSANATGSDNAFYGAFAGNSNTTGNSNSFFGRNAGSMVALTTRFLGAMREWPTRSVTRTHFLAGMPARRTILAVSTLFLANLLGLPT